MYLPPPRCVFVCVSVRQGKSVASRLAQSPTVYISIYLPSLKHPYEAEAQMKHSASLRRCRDPPPPRKGSILDRGGHVLTVAVRGAGRCCSKPPYLRPGLLNNERGDYFQRHCVGR